MKELRQNKINWFKKHKILTVIGVVFILIIIGSASGGSKNNSTSTPSKTTTTNAQQVETKEEPKWDAQAIYDKIQNGTSKTDTETIIGKTGENCTTSDTPGVGSMDVCFYNGGFGSKGSIVVTYLNGTVYSKTKTGF